MNIEIATLLLFSLMILLLITGLPMSFSLLVAATIFILFLWGINALPMVIRKIYSFSDTVILVAVPLFILMGAVLERSGVAEDLYRLMHGLLGRVRGGLAIGTVVICTIFAAMTGISGASTVAMGVIALPQMLKRSYDKTIALGSIAAGGALGILIPPSITMIVYGVFARESVGKLFIGGILPGILLSSLFIAYIATRSFLQPHLAPSVEPEEAFSFRQTFVALKGTILPIILVMAVLGSIFSGAATPTEASAVGALGAIIAAIVRGKFSWCLFKEAIYRTFSLSGMIFWIILGASLFVAVYVAIGGQELVKTLFIELPVNRWVIVILMQLTLFILGCFMDPLGIIMITVPVYVPVIRALGFDPVWFGIIFTMNLEMAYLTPPFGGNLFYLKGVVPPEINMLDLYRAIVPFVCLQALGLAIVMAFPQIALLLPSLMSL